MSDIAPLSPERRAFFQDALAELVEIGMDIAREVQTRLRRMNQYDSPIARLVHTFNELARTIRRTILFAEHLAKPPRPAAAQAGSAPATPYPATRPGAAPAAPLHRLETLDRPDVIDADPAHADPADLDRHLAAGRIVVNDAMALLDQADPAPVTRGELPDRAFTDEIYPPASHDDHARPADAPAIRREHPEAFPPRRSRRWPVTPPDPA